VQAGYLIAQKIPFLLRLERLPDAALALAVAERRLGASTGVTPGHRADVNRYAGMLDLALGDVPQAVARFRAAVSLAEPPSDTTRKAGLNSCLLGVALARAGRRTEARPLLGEPCTEYMSHGLPDPLIVRWIATAR
jgi:Flp pilus assembly protein TadD